MTADEPQQSFVSIADIDLKIYRKRWRALDRYIGGIAKYYEQQEFSRKGTILDLLKRLRAFATGQFNFFYYGFSPRSRQGCPRLSPHVDFPAPDILTAILNQIGYDIEVIQRAADQRILAETNDIISKTLKNADKLAWGSMLPARDNKAVEDTTTVLTYFQKSASLYRIPYSQVALIAVPYTATGNLRDYLGIPHEIGHAVLHHLTTDAAKTKKELKQRILRSFKSDYEDWLASVFEELFADVYGCLIAGPVTALSLQDLCLEYSSDRFVKGDRKHPNPDLRPYVLTQVLKDREVNDKLHCNWASIGANLAQRWSQMSRVTEFSVDETEEFKSVKQKEVVIQIRTKNRIIDRAIDEDGTLFKAVDQIVKSILRFLPGNEEWNGWAGPVRPNATFGTLYSEFEGYFDELLEQVKSGPPESTDLPSKSWLEWLKEYDSVFRNEWSSQKTIEPGILQGEDQMKPGTWGRVLYADGWATNGPNNDPGHPDR